MPPSTAWAPPRCPASVSGVTHVPGLNCYRCLRTVPGRIILGELGKPGPGRQDFGVVPVVLGAAGGALFGLLLFGGFRPAFAGLLTGMICSVVDVLIWRAGTRTADLA